MLKESNVHITQNIQKLKAIKHIFLDIKIRNYVFKNYNLICTHTCKFRCSQLLPFFHHFPIHKNILNELLLSTLTLMCT